MDELTGLRALGADTPGMPAAARARARARLLAETGRERRRRRLRDPLVAALVVGLLAIATHMTLTTLTAPRDEVESSLRGGSAEPRDARVLRELADRARPHGGPLPPEDRYVYTRQRVVVASADPTRPPRTYTDESWLSVSGTRPSRSSELGRTWTTRAGAPRTWPFDRATLGRLAADPSGLAAAAGAGSASGARDAYDRLIALLHPNQGAPPDLRVAAVRTLAQVPGVVVVRGVTDAAGRVGVGLRRGRGPTTLLDPSTLGYLGTLDRAVVPAGEPARAEIRTAMLETGVTAGLGERP